LQRTPYLFSVGAHLIFKKKLPGFSNSSDPENCRFWIDQNVKELPGFIQRGMGDYLTNSNSPTIQPKLKELGIGF
jgi:hypothetical protein